MSDDTPSAELGDAESDHDRLRRLWSLLLDVLLREVARPDVKASLLAVARQFLRENGVAAARRPTSLREGLEGLKATLPFN